MCWYQSEDGPLPPSGQFVCRPLGCLHGVEWMGAGCRMWRPCSLKGIASRLGGSAVYRAVCMVHAGCVFGHAAAA